MIFRKKWRTTVLVEGEKDAMLVARMEGLPEPDPAFQGYPVDLTLPKKKTFIQAVKTAMAYSQRNIYNMFYKVMGK